MMERGSIVIGAGLAGARRRKHGFGAGLAARLVPVTLHEMKPSRLYACAPQRRLCRIGLLQFASEATS